MPHSYVPCNICVDWLNCFPAITFIVAEGLGATSDTIIFAMDVGAVSGTSRKRNRKGGFRRVRNRYHLGNVRWK